MMDKLIFISIPETSIKLMIDQAVSKAISDHLPKDKSNSKTVFNFVEACKYIGISESHGYKLTSKGLIPFSKRGRKNYFDKEKLDEWLLEHSSKSASTLRSEAKKYLNKKAK